MINPLSAGMGLFGVPGAVKLIQYTLAAPLVLRYVETVEAQSADAWASGESKRALVQAMVSATINGLHARGYGIPTGVRDGIDKTAGDLCDLVVNAYNEAGIFHKKQRAPA